MILRDVSQRHTTCYVYVNTIISTGLALDMKLKNVHFQETLPINHYSAYNSPQNMGVMMLVNIQ